MQVPPTTPPALDKRKANTPISGDRYKGSGRLDSSQLASSPDLGVLNEEDPDSSSSDVAAGATTTDINPGVISVMSSLELQTVPENEDSNNTHEPSADQLADRDVNSEKAKTVRDGAMEIDPPIEQISSTAATFDTATPMEDMMRGAALPIQAESPLPPPQTAALSIQAERPLPPPQTAALPASVPESTVKQVTASPNDSAEVPKVKHDDDDRTVAKHEQQLQQNHDATKQKKNEDEAHADSDSVTNDDEVGQDKESETEADKDDEDEVKDEEVTWDHDDDDRNEEEERQAKDTFDKHMKNSTNHQVVTHGIVIAEADAVRLNVFENLSRGMLERSLRSSLKSTSGAVIRLPLEHYPYYVRMTDDSGYASSGDPKTRDAQRLAQDIYFGENQFEGNLTDFVNMQRWLDKSLDGSTDMVKHIKVSFPKEQLTNKLSNWTARLDSVQGMFKKAHVQIEVWYKLKVTKAKKGKGKNNEKKDSMFTDDPTALFESLAKDHTGGDKNLFEAEEEDD